MEGFLCCHPKIQETQVFGVPDDKYGGEVCAWIQLGEAEESIPKEIRLFCKGQISHYKIPRYVKFVTKYPMTGTGKIQKFVMRDRMTEELKQGESATAVRSPGSGL